MYLVMSTDDGSLRLYLQQYNVNLIVSHVIAKIDLGVGSQKVPLSCPTRAATGYAELEQDSEIRLKSADNALYLAKNKARNRVQIGSTIKPSIINAS